MQENMCSCIRVGHDVYIIQEVLYSRNKWMIQSDEHSTPEIIMALFEHNTYPT